MFDLDLTILKINMHIIRKVPKSFAGVGSCCNVLFYAQPIPMGEAVQNCHNRCSCHNELLPSESLNSQRFKTKHPVMGKMSVRIKVP